jgi:hypothetical protein
MSVGFEIKAPQEVQSVSNNSQKHTKPTGVKVKKRTFRPGNTM